MKDLNEIAKTLVNLNIKEINEITNILEKKYDIKFNNFFNQELNSNNKNIINNNNNEPINKKNNNDNNLSSDTLVDIYLKSISSIKLPVIKLIKDLTGLTLTESKKCIDNIPSLIKKSIKFDEAKKIQEEFKKVEAEIEIK
ncbi:MAG: ribosomal protein L7/L12 [Candidatus Shikimatogenerans bostrichidophilus]|nr:MAG: ribosomal protein L7/L12 [Candidatus Shikimatogenerans bostrichidophilus]